VAVAGPSGPYYAKVIRMYVEPWTLYPLSYTASSSVIAMGLWSQFYIRTVSASMSVADIPLNRFLW
jgi:hypothetical protein